jgi:hypothetical protein
MTQYDEILKCYEGVTEEHAGTSFEFGLMNDLYYQLFSDTSYETYVMESQGSANTELASVSIYESE